MLCGVRVAREEFEGAEGGKGSAGRKGGNQPGTGMSMSDADRFVHLEHHYSFLIGILGYKCVRKGV